jgi:hypothetical protein
MIIHFKSLLYALLFLAGFELLIYHEDLRYWILGFMAIVVISGCQRISKKIIIPYLPILFFLGSIFLFYFIDNLILLHIYSVIVAYILYLNFYSIFILKTLGDEENELAKKINLGVSIVTVFLWFAGIIAIELNADINSWAIICSIFVINFIVNHQLLWNNIKKERLKKFSVLLYSLIIAYIISIISFAVLFLPFGYLTITGVIIAVYFIMINYIINKINKELTKVSLSIDILIFVLAVFLVLSTTRWNLVSDIETPMDYMYSE